MELEEIEALSNLSVLSRVDLFNLLGRVEQLNRRLRAERKRRKIDIDNKAPKTRPLNNVRADKLGLTGTWPIMQFKNGRRASVTWFIGTLKNACIERKRLMLEAADFKIGIRKEDWQHKH
jgi:hypothetical protein